MESSFKMSSSPEKSPEKEGNDEKRAEDSKVTNYPNKKPSGMDINDPDKDLEPIEQYHEDENIRKPFYDIYEPKDKLSRSKKSKKPGMKLKKGKYGINIKNRQQNAKVKNGERGINIKKGEQGINIKNGKHNTEVKNREHGIKIKNEETTDSRTEGNKKGNKTQPQETTVWIQITPQMIVTSMKKLHNQKHTLSLEEIMRYISSYYPVRLDKANLKTELAQKIQCACDVGFLTEENKRYRLTGNHDTLHLKESDFKQFWSKYENLRTVGEARSESSKKQPRKHEHVITRGTKRKRDSVMEVSSPSRKRKSAPSKTRKRRRKNPLSCPQPSATQPVFGSTANNKPMQTSSQQKETEAKPN